MVAMADFLFQATGILRNADSDLNTQIWALFTLSVWKFAWFVNVLSRLYPASGRLSEKQILVLHGLTRGSFHHWKTIKENEAGKLSGNIRLSSSFVCYDTAPCNSIHNPKTLLF